MKKSYDVIALGELLIDFTESGSSSQGNQMLEANPGGAPCNVLAMLERLGCKTAFIGKVGNDMFGRQLEKALEEVGIDTIGLVKDKKVHTTLAFVHTFADGDRDFSFYRNPGADMMLSDQEAKFELLEDCKCFHFGSLSMTDEPCRTATKKAIAFLQQEYSNIELILLSLGKEGSMAVTKDKKIFVPAFIQSATIETTGAGDTFCGAASIITTRKGALRVMPYKKEVEEFLCESTSK